MALTLWMAMAGCASSAPSQSGLQQRSAMSDARLNAARQACPEVRPVGGASRELDLAAREEAIRRPDFSPPPDARRVESLVQHFDASLLAFWVASAGPDERLIRVPVRRARGDVEVRYVLCGYSRDALVRSFALQDSIVPRALELLARARCVRCRTAVSRR
ncbi:MAG: hypothetical protein U5K74_02345 [Gemmatimonadaceae bacterium]|nr:hypothetical protein [Gemmatimonadaceae bacterium]